MARSRALIIALALVAHAAADSLRPPELKPAKSSAVKPATMAQTEKFRHGAAGQGWWYSDLTAQGHE